MWIVEVNVLGRKLTLDVRGRRHSVRSSTGDAHSRLSRLRLPRVAA